MLISSLALTIVAVTSSLLATYLAFAQFALFSTMLEEGERRGGEDYADQAMLNRLLERPRDVYLQLAAGRTAFRWLALGSMMALGIASGKSHPLAAATAGAFLLFALEDEIPLRLVLRNPSAYALRLLPPIAFVLNVLRAIAPLFNATYGLSRALVRHRSAGDPPLSVEELTMMAAAGGARLGIEERRILRGIFRSSGILVADIMTPRERIAALDRTATVRDALDMFRGRRKSRLPVCDGTLDRITGVVHAKDFLRSAFDPAAADRPITPLVLDAYFVRQDRKIQELFEELKESRVHLAVVVDRLGRTVGIVSLDDVLEEIVGEIRDDIEPEKPR